jgi:hypothetical protein
LVRYAARSEELDRRVREVGLVLRGTIVDRPPVGAVGAALQRDVAEVVDQAGSLATGEASTTRWVDAVGRAFAAADSGIDERTLSQIVDTAAATTVRSVAHELRPFLRGSPDPAVVRALVGVLEPSTIERLVTAHPELVGPADGMPPEARYAANRALIRRTLGGTHDRTRAATLRRLLRRDPVTHRPRQILLFDPDGDGRLAEVFGTLESAQAVALVVPGIGTDVDDDRSLARRARALRRRARELDPSTTTAVVSWLGYDAPPDPRFDVGALWPTVTADAAVAGGAALRRLVAGLPSDDAPRVALVGHSYGSAVVGEALLEGMPADAVVAAGSPGMLVDRAADFGLDGPELYTLVASGDLVARTRWFGDAPNGPGSGFVRLEAGTRGHSAYFRVGSSSLTNMAAVLVGRTELLVRDR